MAVQKWHREFRVYYTGLEVFKIGVLLMLFVLHLSFYFYQKTSKTHLFLAIYFIGGLGQYVFKIMGQNQFLVEDRYFSLNLSACCTSLGQLFALAAFYQLAKVRLDKYYLLAIIAVFTQLATSTLVYGMLWGTMALINALLLVIVMLRLTFIGLKKKIDGFYILGVAVFISSLGFVVIELLNRNFLIHPYVVDLVFNLSALAVPVGLSLYMGIEASERNKSLSAKLIENEILKNQSIASEQEKQQILASQNETLERQVAERTAALKASQSQLIQSEKLASLGELTAGIAHEIQNPLNFVNNFAEVSAEMIDELTEELVKGDTSEAQAIAQDLKDKKKKINHHGQRASGIVKSMLEHSRTSSGTKEPTNLNALADEYLRLAYHGLRAKDSSFNAEYELMADPDLPLVNVVPQDMGRVLLNLINNAFYACAERAQQGIIGYQPKVTIQTRWLSHAEAPDKGQIEIRVKDNGSGIPEAIREKIFQPFFTTKPTGQGTGLGLSLAYDIVTKGHGGKLELESEEGVGTTFVIQLPVNG
ncbi:MAG: hypothetical protein EAZ89_10285 [Bacteroidetes bacterium]|nr:MAG: hypothetical protein EAZ89_10285 [Bacteroidota bacterium]